jgi:hypothetical protein
MLLSHAFFATLLCHMTDHHHYYYDARLYHSSLGHHGRHVEALGSVRSDSSIPSLPFSFWRVSFTTVSIDNQSRSSRAYLYSHVTPLTHGPEFSLVIVHDRSSAVVLLLKQALISIPKVNQHKRE